MIKTTFLRIFGKEVTRTYFDTAYLSYKVVFDEELTEPSTLLRQWADTLPETHFVLRMATFHTQQCLYIQKLYNDKLQGYRNIVHNPEEVYRLAWDGPIDTIETSCEFFFSAYHSVVMVTVKEKMPRTLSNQLVRAEVYDFKIRELISIIKTE